METVTPPAVTPPVTESVAPEQANQPKSRKRIIDRFTRLKNNSRQLIYYKRKMLMNSQLPKGQWICGSCSAKSGDHKYCLYHRVKARERMQKKIACTRRNLNSSSYKEKAEILKKMKVNASSRKLGRLLQSVPQISHPPGTPPV
jgi:hypothetical protein